MRVLNTHKYSCMHVQESELKSLREIYAVVKAEADETRATSELSAAGAPWAHHGRFLGASWCATDGSVGLWCLFMLCWHTIAYKWVFSSFSSESPPAGPGGHGVIV